MQNPTLQVTPITHDIFPLKEPFLTTPHSRQIGEKINFDKLTQLEKGTRTAPLNLPGVEIVCTFSTQSVSDVIIWQSRVPPGEHYFPPCNRHIVSICLTDVPHGIWRHGGLTLTGRLKAGHLVVTKPGSPAFCQSDFTGEFLHLSFPSSALQRAAANPIHKSQLLGLREEFGFQDVALGSLLTALRPTLNSPNVLSPSFADAVTFAVCLHLTQYHIDTRLAIRGLNDIELNALLEYLRNHLDRPGSVAEVARALGTDSIRLSRLFKQRIGESLSRYIAQMRLAQAYELLHASGMTTTEVAMITGFADLSHFSKQFKKRYGFSPSSLLKR